MPTSKSHRDGQGGFPHDHPTEPAAQSKRGRSRVGWGRLAEMAQAEVKSVLRRLPEPLRAQARQLPVIYLPRPDDRPECHDLEPDTLGLFVGLPLAESDWSPGQLSGHIFLFLNNLWDFSDGDPPTYRLEVRRTLMHELGHYLGLEEDDLDLREL